MVSNFIIQALRGDPVTLFGDGAQTRSFCFVDDLVDGMMRLMDADDEVTGPMNLGNPGEFTIRQLAEIVIELTESKSEIILKPLPEDDPMQRCPDITFAKSTLDWEPTIQLREGLGRTIKYFQDVI